MSEITLEKLPKTVEELKAMPQADLTKPEEVAALVVAVLALYPENPSETENMLDNSKAKLAKKNADMIVANNLKVAGAGFGTDTNVVTLITKNGCRQLEKMDKSKVAEKIMDELI